MREASRYLLVHTKTGPRILLPAPPLRRATVRGRDDPSSVRGSLGTRAVYYQAPLLEGLSEKEHHGLEQAVHRVQDVQLGCDGNEER
jgi:hypothetical protein